MNDFIQLNPSDDRLYEYEFEWYWMDFDEISKSLFDDCVELYKTRQIDCDFDTLCLMIANLRWMKESTQDPHSRDYYVRVNLGKIRAPQELKLIEELLSQDDSIDKVKQLSFKFNDSTKPLNITSESIIDYVLKSLKKITNDQNYFGEPEDKKTLPPNSIFLNTSIVGIKKFLDVMTDQKSDQPKMISNKQSRIIADIYEICGLPINSKNSLPEEYIKTRFYRAYEKLTS